MGAHVSVPMYHRTLPQRLRLEAQRCSACGQVQFPPRAACEACRAADSEVLALSGRGTVHAWTFITAAGAPPEFSDQAAQAGGYYVAIVELEEGPRITAQLTDLTEAPAVGDRVTAVVRKLYREEGVQRYGFKFTMRVAGAANESGS
ncbi:MAG TPA: OB-fold domain-containing protein [Egibacteraceae bacterium]|nr:OB-fold domain-containing protein [Egibacteraceae bacterium]